MNRTLPAYVVDQWTFVAIAFFGAWAVSFGTDDAGKYIAPVILFWTKSSCASISASLLALKMFRSTAFAQHQEEKKKAETWPPFKPEPKV